MIEKATSDRSTPASVRQILMADLRRVSDRRAVLAAEARTADRTKRLAIDAEADLLRHEQEIMVRVAKRFEKKATAGREFRRAATARPAVGRTHRDSVMPGPVPALEGYAARFYDPSDSGTQYELYEDLFERLSETCFDAAMQRQDDVRGLIDHDTSLILGRSTGSTLRLSVDPRGLKFTLMPTRTSYALDLVENMRSGVVDGCSFAFRPTSVMYAEEGDCDVRIITSCKLFDISCVSYPAYAAAKCWLAGSGGRARFDAAADARRLQAQRTQRPTSDNGWKPSLAHLKRRQQLAELEATL